MDFSWSTQLNLTSQAPTRRQQSWALDVHDFFPIADDTLLVRSKSRNGSVVIAANIFQALSICTSFDHNDRQLKKIITHSPWLTNKETELQQIINTLIQSSVIITADSLIAGMQSSNQVHKLAPHACPVFITTCDRPEALERLLDSVVLDCTEQAEKWEVTIIDDSRSEASMVANQQIINRFHSSQSQISLRYHNSESNRALLRVSEASNPDTHKAATFLTTGIPKLQLPTYGAARNRALLLAGASKLIMIDDDVVVEMCHHPDEDSSVKLGSNRRYTHFFDPKQSHTNFCETSSSGSVLTALSQHLGLTLSDSLQHSGTSQLSEDSIHNESMLSLHALSPNSEVILGTCGVIGDPGTASNRWILDLSRDELQNLIHSEQTYRQGVTQRHLISSQLKNTYHTDFALISTVTGIDGRKLLPPYFPVLRNEDFLFGRMVKFLHPNSVIFDQPWFVPHLPVDNRSWSPDDIFKPEKMGLLYFLGTYIEKLRCDFVSDSASTRFEALILIFNDLVSSDDNSLLRIVQTEMATLATAVICDSEKSLSEFKDFPDYWKRDVKKRRDANIEYLNSIDDHFLIDLAFAGSKESQLALFRQLVGDYAVALEHWHEIKQFYTTTL